MQPWGNDMGEITTGDAGDLIYSRRERERNLGPEESQSEDSMGVTCFGRGLQEARGWFQHFGERPGHSQGISSAPLQQH